MSFKVPVFFRNKFSETKDVEKKQQLAQKYKNWYHHEVTQELIKALKEDLEQISEDNDNKWDFTSWFQKKEYNSMYKGKRTVLKKLLKDLDYEV